VGSDHYSGQPVGKDGLDGRLLDNRDNVTGEPAGHGLAGVVLGGTEGLVRVSALQCGDHGCLLSKGVEVRCFTPG
jgi:hypothetical protein